MSTYPWDTIHIQVSIGWLHVQWCCGVHAYWVCAFTHWNISLCISQCKPALMLANASIYCSLFIVSWPSSTVHGLHTTKPTNVYMSTLMVCECVMIIGELLKQCILKNVSVQWGPARLGQPYAYTHWHNFAWVMCIYTVYVLLQAWYTLAGKCFGEIYVIVTRSEYV